MRPRNANNIKDSATGRKIFLFAAKTQRHEGSQRFAMKLIYKLTEQDLAEMDALSKALSPNPLEIAKVWFRGYFYDHSKVSLLFANVPKEEIPYLQNDVFFNAFVHNPQFKTFDIGKRAYALNFPVRIIQGRQDPVNGCTQERLNERLKHSKIFYIERSGHFPWLEQPEAFLRYCKKV